MRRSRVASLRKSISRSLAVEFVGFGSGPSASKKLLWSGRGSGEAKASIMIDDWVGRGVPVGTQGASAASRRLRAMRRAILVQRKTCLTGQLRRQWNVHAIAVYRVKQSETPELHVAPRAK